MTILALACFLVVGAAAASILGRDSVPAVRSEILPAVAKGPLANREGKKDKLPLAMAALPPAADNPQQLPEQLRQAFASDSPFSPQPPKIAAPSSIPLPADKPKARLSDMGTPFWRIRLEMTPLSQCAACWC